MRIILFSIILVAMLVTMSGIAFAVERLPAGFFALESDVDTGGELVDLIFDISNWIFVALLVTSVVFIVLAGFQFVTGGGDPAAVAQARSKLMWAAAGIVVAALARAIPLAIGNIVGV